MTNSHVKKKLDQTNYKVIQIKSDTKKKNYTDKFQLQSAKN